MAEPRKNIRGSNVEAEVLWLSRRRCAICFGVEGDLRRKKGQIAHLNKDRNDNRLENLTFLCMDHHDEFDSITSQTKNFTRKEVILHRDKLYELCENGDVFSAPFSKDDLFRVKTGLFARRSGLNGGANISISRTSKNWDGRPKYLVLGQAFEGVLRPYGPNMGFLGFETTDSCDGFVEFHDGEYTLMLGSDGDRLLVEEENDFGYHGAGAHFFGEYERVQFVWPRLRWWLRSQWVSRFRNGVWPGF